MEFAPMSGLVVLQAACVVLAYRRVVFKEHLTPNVVLWAIPYAASSYFLWGAGYSALGALTATVTATAVYAVGTVVGDWLHRRYVTGSIS